MLRKSQEALGDELGLTFQQIQKYEKGINRISASRLYYLAKCLGVTPEFFYIGYQDDDMVDTQPGFAEGSANEVGLDFLSTREGAELYRAFRAIRSAEKRKLLIQMARSLSDEDNASPDDHNGEARARDDHHQPELE